MCKGFLLYRYVLCIDENTVKVKTFTVKIERQKNKTVKVLTFTPKQCKVKNLYSTLIFLFYIIIMKKLRVRKKHIIRHPKHPAPLYNFNSLKCQSRVHMCYIYSSPDFSQLSNNLLKPLKTA